MNRNNPHTIFPYGTNTLTSMRESRAIALGAILTGILAMLRLIRRNR